MYVSPINEYLAKLNALTVKEGRYVSHFYTREGMYIGSKAHFTQNNTEYLNMNIFMAGFKRLFTECSIVAKELVCLSSTRNKNGFEIVPSKIITKNVFVNHLNRTTRIYQKEETLENNLQLLAYNKKYDIGLYDTARPITYTQRIKNNEQHNNIPNTLDITDYN